MWAGNSEVKRPPRGAAPFRRRLSAAQGRDSPPGRPAHSYGITPNRAVIFCSCSAIWVSGMAPICGIRLTKGLTIISGSIFSGKSNQNNGERRRNIFVAFPALDQGKLYFTGWWYIIKYEKRILWRLWPFFSPPNTNIANICLRLMTKQHML